jgi:hypothetical protein
MRRVSRGKEHNFLTRERIGQFLKERVIVSATEIDHGTIFFIVELTEVIIFIVRHTALVPVWRLGVREGKVVVWQQVVSADQTPSGGQNEDISKPEGAD